MTSEQLNRTVAAIEIAIGAGATFAPEKLVATYGVPASDMNGIATFGMRLFGVRNLAVGLLSLQGNQSARDFTLAIQAPDVAMFAHAFKTGYVSKRASTGALATAGLVTGLLVAARRA